MVAVQRHAGSNAPFCYAGISETHGKGGKSSIKQTTGLIVKITIVHPKVPRQSKWGTPQKGDLILD